MSWIPGKRSLMLNTVFHISKSWSPDATERMVMIGYDDLFAIQYFHQNLKSWWKLKEGMTIERCIAAVL